MSPPPLALRLGADRLHALRCPRRGGPPGVSARSSLDGLGARRSGWVGSSSPRWRPRCFFVAKVPLLTASGVHPFGLIHLVYLDLVGVIPAVGLSLLAAARFAPARGSGPLISPSVRAAALASLGLLAVGFYATFWEPFRLRCRAGERPRRSGARRPRRGPDRRAHRPPDESRDRLRTRGGRPADGPPGGRDPAAGRPLPGHGRRVRGASCPPSAICCRGCRPPAGSISPWETSISTRTGSAG